MDESSAIIVAGCLMTKRSNATIRFVQVRLKQMHLKRMRKLSSLKNNLVLRCSVPSAVFQQLADSDCLLCILG